MKEEVFLIGKTSSLVGILTDPPQGNKSYNLPAILILNAGILHRVGPNRLYVKLARDLAALGFVVLRFDFSGIGDSPVRSDNLPFEKKWIGEIEEVMDCMHSIRGIERFVLIGICSGANISFKAACRDSRVVGAVLINPQEHLHDGSDDKLSSYINSRVIMRHVWRISLDSSFRAKKWLKAIRGEVDFRSIVRMIGFQLRSMFVRNSGVSSEANDVERDFALLTERGVRLLHLYSEGDVGLDYLHLILGNKIRELRSSGSLNMEIIPGSNHTLTLLSNQEQLITLIRKWAQAIVRN